MSVDVLALSFLIVAIVGLILAIIAMFICTAHHNGFKRIAMLLAVLSLALFVSTLLCATDALDKYHVTRYKGTIIEVHRASTSGVTVGLGIVTILLGISSFIMSLVARRNPDTVMPMEDVKEEESLVEETQHIEDIDDEVEYSEIEEDEEIEPEKIEETKEEEQIMSEENKASSIAENAAIAKELKELSAKIEAIINNGEKASEAKDKNIIILTASSNVGMGLWTSICVSCASIFGVQSKNYKRKMDKILTEVRENLESQMSEHPEYEFKDYRIIKERGLAYYGTVIGVRKPD